MIGTTRGILPGAGAPSWPPVPEPPLPEPWGVPMMDETALTRDIMNAVIIWKAGSCGGCGFRGRRETEFLAVPDPEPLRFCLYRRLCWSDRAC